MVLSPQQNSLKRSRFFKKKYKTRNPIEKTILKYFEGKGAADVLDYDELLEKALIFDKVPEPVNPHSLRDSTKHKKLKYHKFVEPFPSRPQPKKRLGKNIPNATNVNLLKIHMDNRKNPGNPVILDKKEEKREKLLPEEEKSSKNPLNSKSLPKPELEQQDKPVPSLFQPATAPMSNFDYEKLLMIPKFNKVMDQNQSYNNLSEPEKAFYQKMFYNRLMHFGNNFDYFNPYYNNNFFGFPDRNAIKFNYILLNW